MVRFIWGGGMSEEREMDGVPQKGHCIQFVDNELMWVKQVYWRIDGGVSVELMEHPI